jgi:transposase-like protein
MDTANRIPETLLDAVAYFSNADNALVFMTEMRWPNGVICPYCKSARNSFLSSRRIWKCMEKECRKQFSVKVGTAFEDSPISLEKWLPCVWLIANAKNGISSYEVGRALGVTQKTAWFMLHRVRLALQEEASIFGGEVEADETYIGGKARFMHKERHDRIITGTGGAGKMAVMGLLERHSKNRLSRVKVAVAHDTRKKSLQDNVRANVKPGSTVYTDELKSYEGLAEDFTHNVINHAERYVDGAVHTNGMENFWCLLKRTIKGTYVAVEPFHLFRYLDEQAFRFNNRKWTDALRFVSALKGVIGKRLTFDDLTGKNLDQTPVMA